MRVGPAEKMEIIRLVEESDLSVRSTLEHLGIHRSTFYNWYKRYSEEGYDGLTDRRPHARRFWNKLPEEVKENVLQVALEHPEQSPRELATYITDTQEAFISESSVYRILKAYDLITSPAYVVLSAGDSFTNPRKRVHELWQTDFTYFKVIGWGWYYLTSVLDDYSRYIIAWKLYTTMAASDVKEVLDLAIEKAGVMGIPIKHRPRLLSDNGACYLSKELAEYLNKQGMEHTRGAPYHPMTQGKIERYQRSMKNVVKLQHYYFPWELEQEIGRFIKYYNHERYHESLNNVKPVDVYEGRNRQILDRREKIKRRTLQLRRLLNLGDAQCIS